MECHRLLYVFFTAVIIASNFASNADFVPTYIAKQPATALVEVRKMPWQAAGPGEPYVAPSVLHLIKPGGHQWTCLMLEPFWYRGWMPNRREIINSDIE